MAKFKSVDLLNDLIHDVRRIKESAQFFHTADKMKMSYTSDENKWSVVQILEHMNAYNRHYLPMIEKELSFVSEKPSTWFSSGFWGEKFTKMMKPTNIYEIKNKMKAMKSYTFPNSLNVDKVLDEFIDHQDKLVRILETAKGKDLNSIRIPVTLTRLIKLKLGDMLRFIVAHEQRHMIQARNTLRQTGVTTDRFPVILQAVPQ